MRWQRLFDDLEAQLAADEAAELEGELRERTRIEWSRLSLVDRLRAGRGSELAITAGADRVRGRLLRVAVDAVVIDAVRGEELTGDLLIPLAAIDTVVGLDRRSDVPTEGPVHPGLGLRAMLRAVGRDRQRVRVHLRDGAELAGTVDAVGADWVELAEHPADEARRAGAVRSVQVIPLHAISTIRH